MSQTSIFTEDHAELREEMRKLCTKYPGRFGHDRCWSCFKSY